MGQDRSPWIELHSGVREHMKIARLAESLDITYAHAVGLLACLWSSPYVITKDGDLAEANDAFIARLALWDGDTEKFCLALRSVGFINADGTIHDYLLHGTRLLRESRDRVNRFYANNPRSIKKERKKERKRDRMGSGCRNVNATLTTKNNPLGLSPGEQTLIRKELANTLHHAENSEANDQAFKNLVESVSKQKDVKNVYSYALKSARNAGR